MRTSLKGSLPLQNPQKWLQFKTKSSHQEWSFYEPFKFKFKTKLCSLASAAYNNLVNIAS